MGGFDFNLAESKGWVRAQTARNVPFENEVFVGDSTQCTHDQYENTQLEKS